MHRRGIISAAKFPRKFETDQSAHAMPPKGEPDALGLRVYCISQFLNERLNLCMSAFVDSARPSGKMHKTHIYFRNEILLPLTEHKRISTGIGKTKETQSPGRFRRQTFAPAARRIMPRHGQFSFSIVRHGPRLSSSRSRPEKTPCKKFVPSRFWKSFQRFCLFIKHEISPLLPEKSVQSRFLFPQTAFQL
jgi:hypothetical protein